MARRAVRREKDKRRIEPDLPALPRNFRVTIDGIEIGFAQISRIGSETAELPARGRAKLVHRYPNILLRRALGRDRSLYQWREAIMAGKKGRRRVEIRWLDDTGEGERGSWILENAWPWRWSGPIFDANATEIAMEEIELAYERLIWR
jgi:phage tail-like protein